MDQEPGLSALDALTVLEGLGDAVVVADRDGTIVWVNASAAELLGRDRSTYAGRPLTDIIPERLRDRHRQGFARYLETRQAALIGAGAVRVPALLADQSEREVELTLSAHEAGGRLLFMASLRDLADRVALEREQAIAGYRDALRQISSRLALADEIDGLAAAAPVLLEAVGPALGWHVGGVWAVEEGVTRPIARWAAPGFAAAAEQMESSDLVFELGVGVPGRVALSGEPAWVEDVASDANFPRGALARRLGLRSCFGFPILTHGRVVAVVELSSADPRPAEPHLLAVVGSAGSEIGRLLERQEARRRELEAERHRIALANALQASLLPPQSPAIPGLDVATRYHAAAGEGQVGGDFYDLFPLADGEWAVVIGDVCGRGPEAAALTALARYTIRAAAVQATSPGQMLGILNDVVLQELDAGESERFLTVAIAVLGTSADGVRARLACGGHPPPHLLAGARVSATPCRGELLGVFQSVEVDDVTVTLRPGDALVLVTDGVLEARGPGGQFGPERLEQILAEGLDDTADALASRLEQAVLDHTRGEQDDDLAIVVVRLPITSLSQAGTTEVASNPREG